MFFRNHDRNDNTTNVRLISAVVRRSDVNKMATENITSRKSRGDFRVAESAGFRVFVVRRKYDVVIAESRCDFSSIRAICFERGLRVAEKCSYVTIGTAAGFNK